jgi:hypothetical protein
MTVIRPGGLYNPLTLRRPFDAYLPGRLPQPYQVASVVHHNRICRLIHTWRTWRDSNPRHPVPMPVIRGPWTSMTGLNKPNRIAWTSTDLTGLQQFCSGKAHPLREQLRHSPTSGAVKPESLTPHGPGLFTGVLRGARVR